MNSNSSIWDSFFLYFFFGIPACLPVPFWLLSAGVNKCISDQCPLFAMTFYIIVLIPTQIMSRDNKNQSWRIWFLWATKESRSNTWKYSNRLIFFFFFPFVNEIFIQDHKVKSVWDLTGETSESSVIRYWEMQERGKYNSELKRLKPSEWLNT